jgi:signal transduction histidine kinase
MNVNENVAGIKLRMEKRRDLYLVFKEALNNILKHAHATMVHIEMHRRDNNVVLAITDNGKGFNVNEPTSRNGLKNMKKRIEKWKGKALIESAIGAGTSLQITLPVSEPSLKRTILKRLHLS